MRQIKTEIIIDAPIAKVWDSLVDIGAWSKWNPFIINARGDVTEGSTLNNTLLNNGKPMQFNPVVTEVIPQRKLAWKGSALAGAVKGEHYFSLKSIGSSQVKLTHGEVFSGWLVWLIFPIIYKQTKAGFVLMNEALKQRVCIN